MVVVEDESLIRLDLVEMLTEAGYEVIGQAGDGETGLRLVDEFSCDPLQVALVERRCTTGEGPIVAVDHGDDVVFELLNEPSFLRYIGDKGVRTREDACQYILAGPMASYDRFGFGDVVAVLARRA